MDPTRNRTGRRRYKYPVMELSAFSHMSCRVVVACGMIASQIQRHMVEEVENKCIYCTCQSGTMLTTGLIPAEPQAPLLIHHQPQSAKLRTAVFDIPRHGVVSVGKGGPRGEQTCGRADVVISHQADTHSSRIQPVATRGWVWVGIPGSTLVGLSACPKKGWWCPCQEGEGGREVVVGGHNGG